MQRPPSLVGILLLLLLLLSLSLLLLWSASLGQLQVLQLHQAPHSHSHHNDHDYDYYYYDYYYYDCDPKFNSKALAAAAAAPPLPSPAMRSLMSLSPEHITSSSLTPTLDGTIHLIVNTDNNSTNQSNSNSKKKKKKKKTKKIRVIWSFSSGPPIYTSYHTPLTTRDAHTHTHAHTTTHTHNYTLKGKGGTNFRVECGPDWALYMIQETDTRSRTRMKFPGTIEDFIKATPYVSEDGAVTLGSKKTTVFEVDLKTGSLIRTYTSSAPTDSLSTFKTTGDQSVIYNSNTTAPANNGLVNSAVSTNQNPAELRLQIIRTDYTLKSFPTSSNQESWNMTLAAIEAVLHCQDFDNPPGGDLLNLKHKISLEIGADIALPLPCQSKKLIFQPEYYELLELPMLQTLPGPLHLDVPGLASNPLLSVRPKPNVHRDNNADHGMLPQLPMKNNYTSPQYEQNVRIHPNDVLSNLFGWSSVFSLALFTIILMGIVIYQHVLLMKGRVLSNEQSRNSDSKGSLYNKKKSQKLETSNGTVDKKDKQVLSDNEDALTQSLGDNKTWLDLNRLFDCGADGRRIGKLLVSNTEIAKGSNGTIVLEGIYEGRPVAVKRLVQAHHDVAFKEIQNLIASDRHPNIVRWYGVERDQDFVYLSLERCSCSLDDLIQIYSDSSQYSASAKDHAMRSTAEYKVHLESIKNIMPDVNFWKANGYPSPLLLKLMRDVVSGLLHLHQLGIIHRDLKPQNVLIIKERSLCAKLSDMGISKRLAGDMSSLGRHATGCGSSGWQAPEQLLHGRQTRAVDLFSLGCVLFFCITGGSHPFGDHLERDLNIVKNQMDLFLVEYMPEAVDLISRLLNPDPELRPKALEVLHHPLFWSSEMRLSFLRDTSDRIELEDRESGSDLLKALEGTAPTVLGAKWNEKMETAFITDIGRYRRYKFDSVRDLLRVMRNKLNHYRELPKDIQELVGSVPDGFDGYFASRFPRLLIEVYRVMCRYCKQEECFQKYFESKVE
ncbi:Serine/threonine protein kinase [Trema orientale]|uniref:non-specific serine/threonine protein kinase n=1 Tax=Trema orientale TaxID=63057 RepID=A0A2P5EB06_TREOI|nr:Serine/threonine protein kinase [Trema orientale]